MASGVGIGYYLMVYGYGYDYLICCFHGPVFIVDDLISNTNPNITLIKAGALYAFYFIIINVFYRSRSKLILAFLVPLVIIHLASAYSAHIRWRETIQGIERILIDN